MANLALPLMGRQIARRRRRRDLVLFLDALSLHLRAGFDLAYSWPASGTALASELRPELLQLLAAREDESMPALLGRLAESYPDCDHRLWFAVLRELYTGGAGISAAVSAMASTLRREQHTELETHFRTLPTRVNVLLLLFYLPPTLLLLFAPLLWELGRALKD